MQSARATIYCDSVTAIFAFSANALSFLATVGERLNESVRRLVQNVIFIPKSLGHCTAFRFGLNTRQLCVRR